MVIRDAVIHGVVPPITKVQGLNFLIYRYGRAAFDFMESKWGPEGIRSFLNEFRKVLLSANIEKAIKEAFGIDADEFDRLFQRYLRQKYLPTLLEKGEPEDYGKQIGFKLPGVHTFSPVLSPSGDLVAVLTTRYYDLDVVILQAKDGKVIKNLTRGFTNEYEFISTAVFEGKADLAWSPDGDLLAFFVRKENRRRLLILNALTGREVKNLEIKPSDPASPSFSPDGKKILFAGNMDGVVDVFEMDIESGGLRNLTDDEYYDSNPSYSSDGKSVLYNRRVDAYWKVFLLDYDDPSRKTQVTFGQTSEVTPTFSRDGKSIYYCSDVDGGIFNIYALDLDSGEVRKYTDVGGGYLNPQDRPAERGKSKVVASAYYGGRFGLYEVDTTKPLKVITPAERAKDVSELKPFEPPLKLTVDQSGKQPYTKRQYHVEGAPNVGVGVASDGTVLGNAALTFTDLLGDHNFWLYVFSVANFQNIDAGYVDLQSRLQHFYRFTDYQDFLIVPTSSSTFARIRGNSEMSLSTGFIYPFSSHYRVEGSIGVAARDIINPALSRFDDPNSPQKDPNSPQKNEYALFSSSRLKSSLSVIGLTFVGDTLRFNNWGPWHGKRFNIGVTTAPFASGSEAATFTDYTFDYRAYSKLTYRSLFAFRTGALLTEGKGATLFGIGGYNQLRGFRYREFIGDRAVWTNFEMRFPLVDELRWPWGGAMRWVRAVFFFDAGAAWTQDGFFFDRELGKPEPLRAIGQGGVFRDFKFWDSSKHTLRDARASYGTGFNFRLGFLDLNWIFAKRLPYEQINLRGPGVDPTNGSTINPNTGGPESCRAAINAAHIFPQNGKDFVDSRLLAAAINSCRFERVSGKHWNYEFYIGYEF